jgi:two-component system nitrate/nitrite response regulator NarL
MDNLRVMIVDDMPHVRQSLTNILELASMRKELGIEVIGEAQNGVEAIIQAHKLCPDVILMDLEMPMMDGYQATRSLKNTDRPVWIVILSIHGDPLSRQKATQAGADAFVEKGAPLDELIHSIQNGRRTT